MAEGDTAGPRVSAGRDSNYETTVRAKFRMDADGETRDAIRWSLSGPTKTLVRGMAGLVGAGSFASILYLSMRNSASVNSMLQSVVQIFGAFVDLIAIQFLPIFLTMVHKLAGALGGFASIMGGGGGFADIIMEVGTILVHSLIAAFHQAWPELLKLVDASVELFGKALNIFLQVVTSPAFVEAFLSIANSFVKTITANLGPFMVGIAMFMMGRIILAHSIGAAILSGGANPMAWGGIALGTSLIGSGIGSEIGAFNQMGRGGSGWGGAIMGSAGSGFGGFASAMGGI